MLCAFIVYIFDYVLIQIWCEIVWISWAMKIKLLTLTKIEKDWKEGRDEEEKIGKKEGERRGRWGERENKERMRKNNEEEMKVMSKRREKIEKGVVISR